METPWTRPIGHIETSDGRTSFEHEKDCGGATGTTDRSDPSKLVCVKCGWWWKTVKDEE